MNTLQKSLSALVLALSSACSMPQRIDDYREHPENHNPNYSAAILVAKPTKWWDYLQFPFIWAYELRVANALNTKLGVDNYYCITNATREDLEKALIDDNVKVLVIAGHEDGQGSWGDFDSTDLMNLFVSHPEIKKEWIIRHTCGSEPREIEYIPRDILSDALQEIRDKYDGTGVSIDSGLGGFYVSDRKYMEEFEEFHKQRGGHLNEEEWDYFMKKGKYLNTVVIPKIHADLAVKFASPVRGKVTFWSLVVEDPSHVLGWNRITTPFDFLWDPLPGLDKAKDK